MKCRMSLTKLFIKISRYSSERDKKNDWQARILTPDTPNRLDNRHLHLKFKEIRAICISVVLSKEAEYCAISDGLSKQNYRLIF